MNALERITDHTPSPFDDRLELRPVARSGEQFQRMANWLDLFMRTAEVAKVLARTAFVPDPMRGEPENVAAAMMRSLELGIDPLDGLANLHVIKGKVGYSAEFMRRRILEAGHELVIEESTDQRCKVRGRRAGTQEWQTASFTAEQARKARINLGDYPADKLVARASSRLCRRVFPDVLAGATILDDVIEVDGETVAVESSPARTVQRKRQPRKVATEEAPVQPATTDVDELLDDPGQGGGNDLQEGAEPSPGAMGGTSAGDQDQSTAMSDENRRKWLDHMFALLGEAHCTDRDDQLIVINTMVGYPHSPIEHRNAIDDDQLRSIVNELNAWSKTAELDHQITEILNESAIIASEKEQEEDPS